MSITFAETDIAVGGSLLMHEPPVSQQGAALVLPIILNSRIGNIV